VTPRGIWDASGQAAYTTIEAWLREREHPDPSPDELVLRYLAAFGPATVRDVQAWCGLTRLGEVVDRLRPGLRTFRDEQGAELFDLPDASRPEPDTPAAPRFLPEYDNVLLSHADRTRVIPVRRSVPLPPGLGASRGTVLLDGFWQATWKITGKHGTVTLRVEPFARLSARDKESITAEGGRLLAFIAPDAVDNDICIGGTNLSERTAKTP
jgi:hypothetical protein